MEKQFNAGLAYSDFKQRQFFYTLAAFVAFTMSSYFVVGYLAGNLHPWAWDAGQWMNAFVGIGITAVMTGYQFVLYSQGNVEGGKKATIVAVCVAVGFSLLSEVGQGMERDNIRMETKSQESPTYKAIVGALAGSTGAAYNPYSADLQQAEMKLARCQERMANGKERDCVQSQARVDAVNKMIANADQQSQSKALALAESAKTMERDEKNYHPLVNLIRETLFVSGTVGSFMLSLTLISFFEFAFHYLGGQYAKAREYLMQNGYDVTRKLRQPPRKHDGSISTYSDNVPTPLSAMKAELKGMMDNAPEKIANEFNQAQNARQQVYSKAADKLDSIQDDLNQAKADKTYRAELREGEKAYSDSPLDKPRPAPLGNGNADYPDRMPLPAMIKHIHADVLASGVKTRGEVLDAVKAAYLQLPNPTPMTGAQLATVAGKISDKLDSTVSTPEPKPHGTGRYNPVLGTAEEQHEMPLPTVHAQHAQTRPSTVHAQTHSHAQPEQARTAGHAQPETVHAQPELTAAARQVEADLYPEWICQVSAKAITAGARDAKRFISQSTFTHGDKTVLAVQEMGRIWLNWQDRAANDGVLKPNPKYQPGNRQPKYLLAA